MKRHLRTAGFLLVLLVAGCDKPESSGLPRVGSRLPNLLRETPVRNAPIGQPAPANGYVVYVFSPESCPTCEENNPQVQALAAALPAEWALLSVAVDETGLTPYMDRISVTVPVLAPVSPKNQAEYKMTAGPRTYLLDSDWRLLEVLDGAYEGEVAKALSARLGIELPSPRQGSGAVQPRQQLPAGACLDNRQRLFSRGAKADALGLRFECGAGGAWTALE
jgi:hypothetical protein